MDLLIAILMFLGVHATPDLLHDQHFIEQNTPIINYSNTCIENGWYRQNEGGVITDVGVGT